MPTAGSGSSRASPARSRSYYTGGLKVVSFSKDGQPGPEIADFENPCALALDPKGRLLVGGLNRHGQVWIYDVSGTPKKVDTFGAEGGIFSGEPGTIPARRSSTGSAAWGSTRPAISTSPASSAPGTTPRSKPIPLRVNDSGTSTAWATGWTRPAPTRPMRTSSTPRRTSSPWTGAAARPRAVAGRAHASIASSIRATTA